MSCECVYVPLRCCSNFQWFVHTLIKNERKTRTSQLIVRDFRQSLFGEECKEAMDYDLDDNDFLDGFHLSALEEKEVATFFIYHCIGNISSMFELINIIALQYFMCRGSVQLGKDLSKYLLPLYGIIIPAYSIGLLVGISCFTRILSKDVLFTTLKKLTIAASALNLLFWSLNVVVFLNIFESYTITFPLLAVSRFFIGLAGASQIFPLAFLRHLSAAQYRQRDDLAYSFARILLAPSIALCVALGLPPLSPEEFNPTLKPEQLFNSLSLCSWLALGLAVSVFTYSIRLPSNNAMEYVNHHSVKHQHRLDYRAHQDLFKPHRNLILYADAAAQFTTWAIGWNYYFLVKRRYSFSIFQLFIPFYVGCLCAMIVNPKTVGLLLGRYRLNYSYEFSCRLCVICGLLLLIGCILSIIIDEYSNASIFLPGFLFGMAVFLINNSIDKLYLLREEACASCSCIPQRTDQHHRGHHHSSSMCRELSVETDIRMRIVAKNVGRMLGTALTGALLTSEPASDLSDCHIQYVFYWGIFNVCILIVAIACLVAPACPCSSIMASTHNRQQPWARVRGDPDSICVSLAQDRLHIDVDVI